MPSAGRATSVVVVAKREECLFDNRVGVRAKRAPVLALLKDLLRSTDLAVVEIAPYRRRLLALGERLRGIDEDAPHSNNRHVGCAEVLLLAVVDGTHRLRYREVLAYEVGDSAIGLASLVLAIDLVVVRGVVVPRRDPREARRSPVGGL